MDSSLIIILILSLLTFCFLIIFLIFRTRSNKNLLELNEIKAQLNILASAGSQSEQAVTLDLSKQQVTLS